MFDQRWVSLDVRLAYVGTSTHHDDTKYVLCSSRTLVQRMTFSLTKKDHTCSHCNENAALRMHGCWLHAARPKISTEKMRGAERRKKIT